MRKALVLILVVLLVSSTAAFAAEWIVPLSFTQGGGWTEVPGAGYGGASAWTGSGMDGVRRAYWKLDLPGMPTTAALYQIYVFGNTGGAPTGWQPIESQFNGSAGEAWPIDSGIPWAGQYGTNHQYLGADWNMPGQWQQAGPGPQGPASADFNAAGTGSYMWLKQGSWLYTKWDYGWPITNTVSAIKIVEVNPVPEPSSIVALAGSLVGLAGFAIRRRR